MDYSPAAPSHGDSRGCNIFLGHVLTKPSILLKSFFNVDSIDVLSEAVGYVSATRRATLPDCCLAAHCLTISHDPLSGQLLAQTSLNMSNKGIVNT
jgi:hypothetical protein